MVGFISIECHYKGNGFFRQGEWLVSGAGLENPAYRDRRDILVPPFSKGGMLTFNG
jgi:hypothetical protein